MKLKKKISFIVGLKLFNVAISFDSLKTMYRYTNDVSSYTKGPAIHKTHVFANISGLSVL